VNCLWMEQNCLCYIYISLMLMMRFAVIVLKCIFYGVFYDTGCLHVLQCFDAVGWAAERASGL